MKFPQHDKGYLQKNRSHHHIVHQREYFLQKIRNRTIAE